MAQIVAAKFTTLENVIVTILGSSDTGCISVELNDGKEVNFLYLDPLDAKRLQRGIKEARKCSK